MAWTEAVGTTRRVRLQATAIAVIVALDGVVASMLGAPAWIAALYIALAVVLAAGRLRLGRPRPVARRPLATPPAEPERRAIGYLCMATASKEHVRETSEAIGRACRER